MADFDLDVRRLLCPMPVIKTQKKVKELADGDNLTVYATDPGAQYDIPAWCRIYGHEVANISESDQDIIIKLKVNK